MLTVLIITGAIVLAFSLPAGAEEIPYTAFCVWR